MAYEKTKLVGAGAVLGLILAVSGERNGSSYGTGSEDKCVPIHPGDTISKIVMSHETAADPNERASDIGRIVMANGNSDKIHPGMVLVIPPVVTAQGHFVGADVKPCDG